MKRFRELSTVPINNYSNTFQMRSSAKDYKDSYGYSQACNGSNQSISTYGSLLSTRRVVQVYPYKLSGGNTWQLYLYSVI